MRTGSLAVAISIATALGVHAAQEPKGKKGDKRVIVVTGCVEGSSLRVKSSGSSGAHSERYRLRGSKQMVKELEKQYQGHYVEVTGAVTDTGSTTHRGKTIDVGKKTRIVTGAKEVQQQQTGVGEPYLEVASFRDIQVQCR